MNLSQYKAKYNLNDVPDEVLADKLYEQYGKGAPKEEFYSTLQYAPQQTANASMQQEEGELPLAEQLYRTLGIHGANRGFSKLFGSDELHQSNQHAFEEAKKTHPKANEAMNYAAQAYSAIPYFMAGGEAVSAAPYLNTAGKAIIGSMIGQTGLTLQGKEEEDETKLGNLATQVPMAGLTAGAFESLAPLASGAKQMGSRAQDLGSQMWRRMTGPSPIRQNQMAQLAGEENVLNMSRQAPSMLEPYTSHPKGQLKQEIPPLIKQEAQAMRQEGSQMFEDFYNTPHGPTTYGNTKPFNELTQKDIPLNGLSKETKELRNSIVGSKNEIQSSIVDPKTGKPLISIEIEPGTHSIKDYVELWKGVMSDARGASANSVKHGVHPKEVAKYKAQADRLNRLGGKIENIIERTIGSEGMGQLQGAKDFWREYVIPQRTVPFMKGALKPTPTMKSDKVLSQFDKYGASAFRDRLLENPEISQRLLQHDLSNMQINSLGQLRKLAGSELAEAFPPQLRAEVNGLLENWTNEQRMLEDVTMALKRQNMDASASKKVITFIKGALSKGAYAVAGEAALHTVLGG